MKKKTVRVMFVVAAGVCVLLRLFQMLVFTEYQTGFMKREFSFVYILISVILSLIILAVPSFALFCNPMPKNKKAFHPAAVLSELFLGGACVFDVLFFASAPSDVPWFLRTVYIFFGALCAAYFAAASVRSVLYFPFSSKLAAIPPAFFTVRAATVFVACSRHAVISDTVFDVFIYCFAMLLFLEIARAINGAGNKNSTKKIVFLGFSVSLLSVCSSLPKIALALVYGSALHDSAAGGVLTLLLGVYAAALTFARIDFKGPQKKNFGVYYAGKH